MYVAVSMSKGTHAKGDATDKTADLYIQPPVYGRREVQSTSLCQCVAPACVELLQHLITLVRFSMTLLPPNVGEPHLKPWFSEFRCL